MNDDLLLPEGSVLLHIGPQKTGSTAIQQAMHGAREQLAERGVLYPGPQFRPLEAGWAVLGAGAPVGRPAPRLESWHRLVSDVRSTALPRACVSNEDFARADDAAVERIVTGLGADRLHVVFVARRLDQLLPSQWQERLKARMTWSYPDFLTRMAAPDDGDWEWWMMWAAQDAAQVVDRWAQHVDRERITVIVSDEDDHGLVPRTFSRMLGLPEEMLRPPTDRSNRSLTFPEAEALRRVNQAFADNPGWTPEQYWRIVQVGVSGALKASPRAECPQRIPGLPASVLDVVNARADAQADAVESAGVQVVGDPASLRTRGRVAPDDSQVAFDTVATVPLDLLGTVVTGAVSGAVELQGRTLRAERRRQKKLPRQAQPDLGTVPGRELATALGGRVLGRLRRLAGR